MQAINLTLFPLNSNTQFLCLHLKFLGRKKTHRDVVKKTIEFLDKLSGRTFFDLFVFQDYKGRMKNTEFQSNNLP